MIVIWKAFQDNPELARRADERILIILAIFLTTMFLIWLCCKKGWVK